MFAIIEDDVVSQEYLSRIILSNSDSEVLKYSTAEAFFRDIKINSFELKAIFMDVTLPGMSGVEALNEIKAYKGYEDTPVIMCSSTKDKAVILQSIKGGAANYLVKPLAKDAVEKMIMTFP